MFKSAIFRLTALYIGILLIISAFLSFNWYRVSVREIDNVDTRLRRNQNALVERNEPRARFFEELIESQQEAIAESKDQIKQEIILTNIALLVIGGIGAYYLARRSLRPIEASHQSLERFTSDASHELRTPLTSMRAQIEATLRSKKPSSKELKELSQSNLEDVAHMSQLVDNLLTLTRNQSLASKPTAIASIVKRAVKNTASDAKTKKIVIKNTTAKASVVTNSDAATQIVTILLDNAIKYSPQGSHISLSGKLKSNTYTLCISDSGKGIDKAEASHIFERFYRADKSRGSEGFGLGLSIARKLAQQIGAEVTLASSSPKGSTFEVRFNKA